MNSLNASERLTVHHYSNLNSFTKIHHLIPEDLFNNAVSELKDAVEIWKKKKVLLEKCATGDGYAIETVMAYRWTSHEGLFPTIKLTKNGCIADLKAFKNNFISSLEFPFDKPLHNEIYKISKIAVEALAHERQLKGKNRFRINLKCFTLNKIDPSKNTLEIPSSLGWHYDYEGMSTLAMELFNDFSPNSPGKLLFAQNGWGGKLNRKSPYNCMAILPIFNTITTVQYPEPGGALLFDGFQGKQIHSSDKVTIQANKTGVMMRAILQVVHRDDKWV